jgi:hypothetical protein
MNNFIVIYIITRCFFSARINYEINGSDALVTFQYYLNNTDNYLEYFGKSNEIILPLLIDFIQILYFDLNIYYFSFIINSIITIIIYFSLSRILSQYSDYDKNWGLLIFFSIFEYGTTLQLMRQSLGIAILLIGFSCQSFVRFVFYTMAIFTHTASLIPIILVESYSRGQKLSSDLLKFTSVKLLLILLMPLLVSEFWSPHTSLVSDEYFKNVKIRDYLYLLTGIYFLFYQNIKLKKMSLIILLYYITSLFYSIFGIYPLFERMFLFINLVVMPLILVFYIDIVRKRYIKNIKKIVFFVLNIIILLNIFFKEYGI